MKITENCSSASLVSFRTGEEIAVLAEPENTEELVQLLQECRQAGRPYLILGNGSNTLFVKRYEGVVIRPGKGIASSKLLSEAAKEAAKKGLGGLEFASGIPGSLGGGVVMNAGAYGGELKQVIDRITSVDVYGNVHERTAEEAELSYRHSCYMENGEVITDVSFFLHKEDPAVIEAKMKELAEKRKAKQPLSLPSAGSFFKRPQGYFAGKLIEDSGLKGLQTGGARVSPLHAGFIVNNGNATAQDIVDLMHIVQETVFFKTGVLLEPEVRLIGDN